MPEEKDNKNSLHAFSLTELLKGKFHHKENLHILSPKNENVLKE